jgi:UDP-N-acetylmuramoyl-L-alanyl-D-glutamate--2,6-diaminopimelate ligase
MKIDLDNVKGIAVDSREVKPGYIFVAIKGSAQDGHNYIEKALENGAMVIVHQDDLKQKDSSVEYVKVDDSRIALADLVVKLYPKQPKYIMGVTGTNGKSSTVHFIREILNLLSKKAVSVGTLGVLGSLEISSKLTTPSIIEMHKILHKIAENDIDYVALECSSHGIEQRRLDKVNFTACAFTNFSQDHLDYHHTMEEYFKAKLQLFDLMKKGYAILNVDIPEYDDLLHYCLDRKHKVICYGPFADQRSMHNIVIDSIEVRDTTQKVSWDIDGFHYETILNLVGEFQVYNVACAIGLLMACGISFAQIMPLLSELKTVTGRMELVATHNGASIFVDYAHKPEALEHALKTLRLATKNKLYVVFGCGGDRDQGKRPMMGKIAQNNADVVIVTDDNPRSEDPSIIRKEVLASCDVAIEIADREEAIKYAISCLKPGDNLVIAGKGHEHYQIIGDKTIEFSDSQKVLEIIKMVV